VRILYIYRGVCVCVCVCVCRRSRALAEAFRARRGYVQVVRVCGGDLQDAGGVLRGGAPRRGRVSELLCAPGAEVGGGAATACTAVCNNYTHIRSCEEGAMASCFECLRPSRHA